MVFSFLRGPAGGTAGVTSGDKLMLMLSSEGIKELKKEEERRARQQLQEALLIQP
jgi:hypothetical protein